VRIGYVPNIVRARHALELSPQAGIKSCHWCPWWSGKVTGAERDTAEQVLLEPIASEPPDRLHNGLRGHRWIELLCTHDEVGQVVHEVIRQADTPLGIVVVPEQPHVDALHVHEPHSPRWWVRLVGEGILGRDTHDWQ
jgi:hypothetical protein